MVCLVFGEHIDPVTTMKRLWTGNFERSHFELSVNFQ